MLAPRHRGKRKACALTSRTRRVHTTACLQVELSVSLPGSNGEREGKLVAAQQAYPYSNATGSNIDRRLSVARTCLAPGQKHKAPSCQGTSGLFYTEGSQNCKSDNRQTSNAGVS